MRKLLLCLLTFFFLTINAQNSIKNNFFLSKTATEFFQAQREKTKRANRIVRTAQISKTINVPTAGTLDNLLTPTEKRTVTDLTVTGNLDARDFRILRDSLTNLTALNLSTVTVASYSGSGGTGFNSTTYPANEIPENAFYNSGEEPGTFISKLTSIILPSTVTSLGSMAFTFCSSLTSISVSSLVTQIGHIAFVGCGAKINVDPANPNYSSVDGVLFDKAKTTLIQCPFSITGSYDIPSSVNAIAMYGFCFCDKLTSVNIPSTVESIEIYAFTSCSGMVNIDSNNKNYTSLDGVLFNKSASKLIQCGTSKTGSYSIPSSVDSISDNAFYNCSLMTSVSIPSSIVSIADFAFYNCSGLTSITVNGLPVSLGSTYGVFDQVNTNACILNVPFGTKSLYQSASGWSSFTHIVENTHGLVLGTNKLILSSVEGSTAKVKISTNDAWTAVSNQSWLKVSPLNGSGNDSIQVTAEANPSSDNRLAIVTVTAEGSQPQILTITQSGLPKTINITAGSLATSLTAVELSSIINLKITGTMDARDFKILRDNMPKLSFLDLSEVNVTAYNGPLGTASWITAYSASRIPDYAFNVGMSSQQYTLASVKLPTTITAVGDYAFYSCEALTDIVIPNSVAYIGTGGFGSCYNLVNVTLPNQLTSIESQAFTGCGFSSIIIPNTVKTIAYYGFSSCRNLRSVVIPNSVSNIANSAFESCISLTDLTIGNSVTYIGNSAFSECSSLASVVIPNSVTLLDGNAFGNCTNLKSVSLPNSLTAISSYCFYQCINLPDITIPNSVTSIGYSAFSYCSALNTLTIPNSVTSIGSSAFYGCTGLTSIQVNRDIPIDLSASINVFNNVNKKSCILNVPFGTKNRYAAANQWQDFTNISENIHGIALSTDSVKLLSTEGSKASVSIKSNDSWTISSNQTWLTVSPNTGIGNDTLRLTANANVSSLKRTATVTVVSEMISKTITVIQAASPKTVNITTAGWLITALTTDELNSITDLTITGIINAFDFKTLRDNMPKLENLDISNANIVTYSGSNGTVNYSYTYPANEIPPNAFFNSSTYAGKTILKTIILPASITSIGSSAFQYCNGLTKISIPNSVTSIGGSAFVQCFGLSDIKISTSLKSIASNTFQYCSGLSNIAIPNSVKSISDYAFQYCSRLTELIIPDSVSSLGWYSFANCVKLKNVTLGKSLTSINYGDFQNCTSLTNVVMTNSLKTIGDYSFGYTALTNLIIPESVTSIGYSSFGYCSALNEVVLPNSLTTINDDAFIYCTGLTKITLGNAVTTIKGEVFYGCTNLAAIIIPETVTSIGSNAFNNCTGLKSITANPLIPVDLSNIQTVFSGVDKTQCILNVPYQTKSLYSTADQWKDFANIVENPYGLKIDLNAARLSPKAGSNVGVNVISNTDWKAVSNQTWLTVSSGTGTGNKLITLTADENVSGTSRMAQVIVSAVGLPDKTIAITQAAASKTVQVTAGGLFTSLTTTELNTVSNLILTGTIDARDFKTMRDYMPLLSDVDLSGTTIAAYNGTEGTYSTSAISYSASAIPQYAFNCWYTSKAKTSLISVVLPASVLSIGYSSFQNCSGLFSIKLPETLNSIGDYAFQNCVGLVEITFPNALLTTGISSFSGCKGLASLKFGNSLNTINNNAFEYCSALRTVVLPNSVATLGGSVFQYCTALTDFTFGNSITSTGSWTFLNCSSLKNVVLSNSITAIGFSSFQSCTNLTNVAFGKSLTAIGSSAFTFCSKLDNVVIPNTVITLDSRAFSNCTLLKNITLSNSITAIGSEAFWSCYGLTDISLPNSVTSIGDGAFYSCSSLKNIKFSSTLKTIESSAFSNCSGLIDVVVPNSVTTIGDYAFSGCSGMKSITIPAGISTLGYSSISSGSLTAIYSLADVPITPNSTGVFSYVNKSTCILYVPKGSKAAYQSTPQWKDFNNISEDFGFLLENQVIHIKSGGSYTIDFPTNNAFTAEPDQSWLKASNVPENGNNKIVLTSDINPDNSLRTALLKISVTNGPTRTFTVIQSGSLKSVTVSSGNLRTALSSLELNTVSNLKLSGTIDARDFRVMRDSMPQLTDIDLKDATITAYSGPDGTNPSIGSYPANETPINSFYKTYSGIGKETLANVVLPINITSIGKSSFAYATGLSSIVIPDQVITINETAFARCDGLKDLTIGNSVTTIGVEAFWICTKLSGVAIPNSVTTISSEAFSNCYSLKWVTFPIGLKTLGSSAFSACKSLVSIDLPNSITTLEDEVFAGCSSLTKANIPNTITELKYSLFDYCISLKEIIIPASVNAIGPRVFSECSSLTTISIPATVTKMDYNVFENCTGLRSIYAYQLTPINFSVSAGGVFYNVDTVKCNLYVPQGTKLLYKAANQWKSFNNIIEMITAVPTLTGSNINIYPNPVKESFSITGLNEAARIILTDINGKQILTRQAGVGENIPVYDLSRGMYILRIVTSEGTLERKLIKE